MSNFFNKMQEINNETCTTNGDKAFKSTNNPILNLFFEASSLRKVPTDVLRHKVVLAAHEDKELAIKCLFYLRDVLEGQGERKIFREGMKVLSEIIPHDIKHVLKHIPSFGRWDDMFVLYGHNKEIDSEIKRLVLEQYHADLIAASNNKNVSLLAKWLPSVNTSSKATVRLGRLFAKEIFNLSEKSYRKSLSQLRKVLKIVEHNLTTAEYETINYKTVPGKALLKYRAAFHRNDFERFSQYKENVKNKTEKVNTKTLSPYDIVKSLGNKYYQEYLYEDEIKFLNTMWNELPDFFSKEDKSNYLAVIDTSGSMNGTPFDVAASLGLYIANHNHGVFKNKFISFSSTPELVSLKNPTKLSESIKQLWGTNWSGSTNLEAVYDLIFDATRTAEFKPEDLPSVVVIISDMQFNSCTVQKQHQRTSTFEAISKKYESAGLTMPKLLFWNVAEQSYGTFPVTMDEDGVVLIGGYKPILFDFVIKGSSPINMMMNVLTSDRYKAITIK